MTEVKIFKNHANIVGIECSGHAGAGVYGEDIVCAALSSIVQTAALGLLGVVKTNINLKRDEAKGCLKFEVPHNLSQEQQIKASAILDTMEIGMRDLYESYSDFIDLKTIEVINK